MFCCFIALYVSEHMSSTLDMLESMLFYSRHVQVHIRSLEGNVQPALAKKRTIEASQGLVYFHCHSVAPGGLKVRKLQIDST